MPRSCRPGLRGIAVFGRCGAGASAMVEVYRRAAPSDHPNAGALHPAGPHAAAAPTATVAGRLPEPDPVQAGRDRVERDDRDEVHGVARVEPDVAWSTAYHSPADTQPTCHRTLIAADRVARSPGVTRSIENALKIGLPAFISEFRTAIARITVHSTGENPSTTRNGIDAPWTITTEVICPNRRASRGWRRIATTVPSDVDREHGVELGEVEAELALDEQVEERDHLAGADRDQEPGDEQLREQRPVADGDPERHPRPARVRGERGGLAQPPEPGRRRPRRPVVGQPGHGERGPRTSITSISTRITR